MISNQHSRQLTTHLIKDQIAVTQQQLQLEKSLYCQTMEKSNFYSNTLTGLLLCNELSLKNAQLRELYYYRVQMMRTELSELSEKLEKFKLSLKLYMEKPDGDK